MTIAEMLGAGGSRVAWERSVLVALALQARSAWLLLGVWIAGAGATAGFLPGRLRVLPAHPDWFLATLVENLAIGLVMVWAIRRLAVGWTLALAVVIGGIAWGTAFFLLPEGSRDFSLVLGMVLEIVLLAILFGVIAAGWRLLGAPLGLTLASLVGGAAGGAMRLLLTDTVFGMPWPKSYWRDLVPDVTAVALLGMVLGFYAWCGSGTGPSGSVGRGPASRRTVAVLGAQVLLFVTLGYLELAFRYSGWMPRDALRLILFAAALAFLGVVVVLSLIHTLLVASRDQPGAATPVQTAGVLLLLVLNVGWILRILL